MGNYKSQAGQDEWVDTYVFRGKRHGFFLDIGAYDGLDISNTLFLERHRRWVGICVEADPLNYERLIKNRRCICVNALVGEPGQEVSFLSGDGTNSRSLKNGIQGNDQLLSKMIKREPTALEDILNANNAPDIIDYLSVDVEGMEDSVMQSFFASGRIALAATIERPSEWLRSEFRKRGYHMCIDQPGLDAFFLHKTLCKPYLINTLKVNRFRALPVWRRPLRVLVSRAQYLFKYGFRSYINKRSQSALFIDL